MSAQPASVPDLPQARTPMWLTADERADLTSAIVTFLDTVRVFPAHQALLADVLLELEVTSARDRLWPTAADPVRRAAGYSPDTVAVRMSADERRAIATLPNLPAAVSAALT